MSKVNISVDTKEKTMKVEVDGKELKNVEHAMVQGGEYFNISLCLCEDGEEDGDLHTRTYMSAATNSDIEQIKADNDHVAEGNFIKYKKNELSASLANLFS